MDADENTGAKSRVAVASVVKSLRRLSAKKRTKDDLAKIAWFLKSSSRLWSTLPERVLLDVCQNVELLEVEEDTTLFKAGDLVSNVFIVASGDVQVAPQPAGSGDDALTDKDMATYSDLEAVFASLPIQHEANRPLQLGCAGLEGHGKHLRHLHADAHGTAGDVCVEPSPTCDSEVQVVRDEPRSRSSFASEGAPSVSGFNTQRRINLPLVHMIEALAMEHKNKAHLAADHVASAPPNEPAHESDEHVQKADADGGLSFSPPRGQEPVTSKRRSKVGRRSSEVDASADMSFAAGFLAMRSRHNRGKDHHDPVHFVCGDVLGAAAALTVKEHTFDATAGEECILLTVDAEFFEAIMKNERSRVHAMREEHILQALPGAHSFDKDRRERLMECFSYCRHAFDIALTTEGDRRSSHTEQNRLQVLIDGVGRLRRLCTESGAAKDIGVLFPGAVLNASSQLLGVAEPFTIIAATAEVTIASAPLIEVLRVVGGSIVEEVRTFHEDLNAWHFRRLAMLDQKRKRVRRDLAEDHGKVSTEDLASTTPLDHSAGEDRDQSRDDDEHQLTFHEWLDMVRCSRSRPSSASLGRLDAVRIPVSFQELRAKRLVAKRKKRGAEFADDGRRLPRSPPAGVRFHDFTFPGARRTTREEKLMLWSADALPQLFMSFGGRAYSVAKEQRQDSARLTPSAGTRSQQSPLTECGIEGTLWPAGRHLTSSMTVNEYDPGMIMRSGDIGNKDEMKDWTETPHLARLADKLGECGHCLPSVMPPKIQLRGEQASAIVHMGCIDPLFISAGDQPSAADLAESVEAAIQSARRSSTSTTSQHPNARKPHLRSGRASISRTVPPMEGELERTLMVRSPSPDPSACGGSAGSPTPPCTEHVLATRPCQPRSSLAFSHADTIESQFETSYADTAIFNLPPGMVLRHLHHVFELVETLHVAQAMQVQDDRSDTSQPVPGSIGQVLAGSPGDGAASLDSETEDRHSASSHSMQGGMIQAAEQDYFESQESFGLDPVIAEEAAAEAAKAQPPLPTGRRTGPQQPLRWQAHCVPASFRRSWAPKGVKGASSSRNRGPLTRHEAQLHSARLLMVNGIDRFLKKPS